MISSLKIIIPKVLALKMKVGKAIISKKDITKRETEIAETEWTKLHAVSSQQCSHAFQASLQPTCRRQASKGVLQYWS